MVLAKQTVPIAFGGGVDTKTDPASVPMGKWLTLENCVFSKPKSLHKRNGYTSLATGILGGGNVSVGQAIAARNAELVLGDGTNLYSYDQANASWVGKGALPNATIETVAQVSDSYSLTQYDTALHSGGLQIIVGARMGGGGLDAGLVYSVVDSATGQQVVPLTQIDTASNGPEQPKVCVLGGFFFIVWRRTVGTQTLVAQAIAVTTPQTLIYGSPQAVTSGVGTSAFTASGLGWDLTVSNGEIYVVFPNNSGTVTIFGITAVGTYTLTHSTVVGLASAERLCICGNPFNNDLVVGVIPTAHTTIVAFAYNSTLVTQTLAPLVLDTQASGFVAITALGTSASATSIQFFATWATGATFDDATFIRKVSLGAAYASGAASTVGRQLKVCGKPVLVSGAVYLPATTTGQPTPGSLDETLQNTWFLINTSGQPIASAFPGNGAGFHQFGFSQATANTLPETVLDSSGRILAPVGLVTSLSFGSGGGLNGASQTVAVALVRVTFAAATQFTRAQLGDVLLLSGAVPRMYDGAEVVEQGFLTFPEIVSITHAAGGGMSAGTYQFIPVYEWWDAAGQVHRSAPGPAFSVTVLASEKATVTVSTLRLTQKSGVLVSLFRTTANGTLFHKVSNTSASSVLLSDPTVATVTFVDSADDAFALAQVELYTDGGGLPASAPSGLSAVVTHRNRIFGIDPTTGQIQYTKQYIPGSTGQPIEFSGFLTLSLDTRGGKPTALASLDEKLIVFKADRMFMVLGQGPDATGAQSDFSDALFVSSDTGCTNPKSIVTVPSGLMFQSPKGIYLLGRDLSLSYIGADVEAYTSAASVTSAQLIPSANQVRFSLDTTVLVYDYYVGQWSVFTNIAAADATIWGGKYTYLTAAGVVNQESAAFADPGNTFIRIRAVSPWVQLGQIQGFQRVYTLLLLGTFASAHSLIVKLAYDFATGFAQTDTIPVASDPAPLQFRIHCAKQKCGAFQISIEDASTGTIGESLSLSGLMLEAGIKGGPFRLPAAKSYG